MAVIDLFLIFCIGATATFFFVATGGVGLVTLPALILMGMSPQVAIATDLFAMLGGRLGGMIGLAKAGKLDLSLAIKLSMVTAFGASLGAFTLLAIDEQLMKQLLAGLLSLLLLFLVIQPRVGLASVSPSPAAIVACFLLFILVGFWGTLVGAGVISLGSAVLLFVMGKSFLESAAILTVVGFTLGIVALLIFGFNGKIDWLVGAVLLSGKLIGGLLGSRFALRIGEKWIRRVFLLVVSLSLMKMILG